MIKDDDDDDDYDNVYGNYNNNNNNNNNIAQIVLKKRRLVYPKKYCLILTEEMQDLGTGNTLQVPMGWGQLRYTTSVNVVKVRCKKQNIREKEAFRTCI